MQNKIGAGRLMGPKGVAVDRNGHIIAVDNKACCVFIFQSNGKLVTKFGARGTSDRQFAGTAIEHCIIMLITPTLNNVMWFVVVNLSTKELQRCCWRPLLCTVTACPLTSLPNTSFVQLRNSFDQNCCNSWTNLKKKTRAKWCFTTKATTKNHSGKKNASKGWCFFYTEMARFTQASVPVSKRM